MSFLDRIDECNRWTPERFRPFVVDGIRVGLVRDDIVERIGRHTHVFQANDEHVALNPALRDFASRSEAIRPILRTLEADGLTPAWRDEAYPVGPDFASEPLLEMDRSAIPTFGIRARGLHVNGFVRDGPGGDAIRMWIGRRSDDKPTYPGQLDNMVAGGQPIGLSLEENLVKEAAEEADIPEALARKACPVGAITYCSEVPEGLKPDVLYCYDLELPADFTPHNTDGEIAEFFLLPIKDVLETVAGTTAFKFNCNLVIIDFAMRHGLIPPDHPDYVEIARGLRR